MLSVSVIIPVYNSEQFIVRCAKSLFNQTLRNIELIFVDDASTDKSVDELMSVIKRYPALSSSVTIIQMEHNCGQAVCFKKALDIAKGEYVIKCDSDDEVLPTMYEDMYSYAMSHGHDVVICDIKFLYPGGNTHRFFGRIEGVDDIESILCNTIPTSLCNRLVKRNLFYSQGFQYPSDSMCEDFVYSIQLAYFSESTGYIPEQYYVYYRHPMSFTWNGRIDAVLSKHDQTVRNIKIGLDFLKSHGLEEKYKGAILRQCLFVKNGLKYHLKEDGVYPIWKDTFREANSRILFCAKIPFKERVVFALIYSRLYGLYKKIKKNCISKTVSL